MIVSVNRNFGEGSISIDFDYDSNCYEEKKEAEKYISKFLMSCGMLKDDPQNEAE